MTVETLAPGDSASLVTYLDEALVNGFARLSGDDNPIHMDDAAAREAGFRGRIAHGALGAAMISRLLGTELPGKGTIYLSQELRFVRPVYLGETATATVTVTSVRPDKPIIELSTEVHVGDEAAILGKAVVLFRP